MIPGKDSPKRRFWRSNGQFPPVKKCAYGVLWLGWAQWPFGSRVQNQLCPGNDCGFSRIFRFASVVALLQRVQSAAVDIDGERHAAIGGGLLVLLGVGHADTAATAAALAKKVAALRIFNDAAGKMNLSVADIQGEALVVSQFTLLADTQKGNRPSFVDAAKPELAIPLYAYFVAELGKILGKEIKTGRFGADMQVSLVNDGPVTIWLEV